MAISAAVDGIGQTKWKKKTERKMQRHRTFVKLKKTWVLYLFVLPAFVYILVLHYFPMYGLQMAFQDYDPMKGFAGSEWVGFSQFAEFFQSYQFGDLIRNTFLLSLYGIVAGFPLPILYALLLNYIPGNRFRKASQMITYAPHFISTVVFCGMVWMFMAQDGIINNLLGLIGINGPDYMGIPSAFPHIYVWSGVLQGFGFGSIIYISALSGVSPELHEAAIVDGATKLQRMVHIDLPSIAPTAIILLIMSAGNLLSVGFEKAFLLQNAVNMEYSEVISTYTYRIGIQGTQFSYASAIGLFNNMFSFIVLIIVNRISGKVSETSLW